MSSITNSSPIIVQIFSPDGEVVSTKEYNGVSPEPRGSSSRGHSEAERTEFRQR